MPQYLVSIHFSSPGADGQDGSPQDHNRLEQLELVHSHEGDDAQANGHLREMMLAKVRQSNVPYFECSMNRAACCLHQCSYVELG